MVKKCLNFSHKHLETLGRTVKSCWDLSRDSISVWGLCFEVFEAKPDKAIPALCQCWQHSSLLLVAGLTTPAISSHQHCYSFVAIPTSLSCHVGSGAKGVLNTAGPSRLLCLVALRCAAPVPTCDVGLPDH